MKNSKNPKSRAT